MKDRLEKALVYESQGLSKDAFKIYKEVLNEDPNNEEAKTALKRVISNQKKVSYDKDMLDLFFSLDKNDTDKFKKWLVDI